MKRTVFFMVAIALLPFLLGCNAESFELEAVDLGLSVKWANANLGATSPEDYGDYYAWGETEPKSESEPFWGSELGFPWSTYKWCKGDRKKLTKYCPSGKRYYWAGPGSPDGKRVLDLVDDAAHAQLGGKWRMPTKAEWEELIEYCTWTWTDNYKGTGKAGQIVTSKIPAYTNNSIFLPASGYWEDSGLDSFGYVGDYWSSSLDTGDPSDARNVLFTPEGVYREDGYGYHGANSRVNPLSIRPVSD